MKRKAPQAKQLARKSTRNSIRIQNLAWQQREDLEDEEEELSREEESTMMVPSAPLGSEEFRRQMMTDDEDEAASTAGYQTIDDHSDGKAEKTPVTNANGAGAAEEETTVRIAAQPPTEERPNQHAKEPTGLVRGEQQLNPRPAEQAGPQPENSQQPVQEQQAADSQKDHLGSQQENSDDFIVSIDSQYSTPPESVTGNRTAASQLDSQLMNTQQSFDLACSTMLVNLDSSAAVEAVEETGWVSNETVHAFKYRFKAGVTDANKIAAFDLDGTLITPKSNATFSKDINDWKLKDGKLKKKIETLVKQGYNFVIFSNQMGVSYRFITLKQIKTKFENIVRHIGQPCVALLATGQDGGRKPAIGMLEFYRTINSTKLDLQKSFFVGDAMGRPKDHSAADLLFAFNCRMPFIAIESFLSGFEQPKLFTYEQLSRQRVPGYPVDPANIKTESRIMLKECSTDDREKEFFSCDELVDEIKSELVRIEEKEDRKLCVVLMIGLFGSGKSYFVRKFFESEYEVIEHEAGRGFEEDKRLFKNHLENRKLRIVIDYPNLDYNERKRWISLAKAEKAVIIGVHLDLHVDQCAHNVRFRSYYTDHDRKAPTPNQILKQHVNFRAPDYFEGFDWIYQLGFIPSFDVPQKKVYYSHFLYDKP